MCGSGPVGRYGVTSSSITSRIARRTRSTSTSRADNGSARLISAARTRHRSWTQAPACVCTRRAIAWSRDSGLGVASGVRGSFTLDGCSKTCAAVQPAVSRDGERMLWNGLEIRLGITRLVMHRARRASRACDGIGAACCRRGDAIASSR